MDHYISDIAFSKAVKAQQTQHGSRHIYQRMAQQNDWQVDISPMLAQFISQRDSFYLASANSEGQAYIQHRGGPKGFLKVIDQNTLAFADFSGNRQYITIGNLTENSKVHLFLMDYQNRRRVKIWGEAKVLDKDHPLRKELEDNNYQANIERLILIRVTAWDINCPQHINPR